MNKAILEFKEKYKDKPEIDHVIDFLKDQYAHKNSINFNYDQALEKANQWVLKLNQKNKDLTQSGKTKVVKTFKNNFKIVQLLDDTSRQWEGLHMSHCVASDNYQNHKGLYSLRDEKENPHCTIEVLGKRIDQIKGKGNGPVHPKYIHYVLDFVKSLKISVNSDDLKNIGYYLLSKREIEFLEKCFEGFQIESIGKKKYLYVYKPFKMVRKLKKYGYQQYCLCMLSRDLKAIEEIDKVCEISFDCGHYYTNLLDITIMFNIFEAFKKIIQYLETETRLFPLLIDSIVEHNRVHMLKYLLETPISKSLKTTLRSIVIENLSFFPSNNGFKEALNLIKPTTENLEDILLFCCKDGDYSKVQILLNDYNLDISKSNSLYLEMAVNSRNLDLLKLLVSKIDKIC